MPEVKEDTVRGYLRVFSSRPAAPGVLKVVGGIRHLPGVLARIMRVHLPANKYKFVRVSLRRILRHRTQISARVLFSSRHSGILEVVGGIRRWPGMAWVVRVYLPANKYRFVRASLCRIFWTLCCTDICARSVLVPPLKNFGGC